MSIFAIKFSLGNIAGNYKLKLSQRSPLSSQRKRVEVFINEYLTDDKESYLKLYFHH